MTVYFPYLLPVYVHKLLRIFQTKKAQVSELIDLTCMFPSYSPKDDTTRKSFLKHMKLAGLCLEVYVLFSVARPRVS